MNALGRNLISILDLTNSLGRNLTSVLGLTNPPGQRLISDKDACMLEKILVMNNDLSIGITIHFQIRIAHSY